MGQYYSMSYPRVALRFTLGCLTLAAPMGLVFQLICVFFRIKSFVFILQSKFESPVNTNKLLFPHQRDLF